MKDIIADRVKAVDASGIRKVFALAAELESPINFSIGQPDFDVPDELKEVAIRAIKEGRNKYSQTAGVAELREKIADCIKREIGWSETAVLVTSGVSGGLLLAFMAMVNPGDEVIIPDPYFVIYKHVVNMLGGKCVFVDTYPDFQLDANKIEDAITDRTKLIVINSPCNPTGVVYSEYQLKAVAEVARKNDIVVLTDEIYNEFSYDAEAISIAKYYEKVLILRGFGKSYAMTGWRLGYAVATGQLRELIEQMAKLQQYTFVCAPRPFQDAAMAALGYDVSGLVDRYRKKRDLLYERLSSKFELVRPSGAFYAFVKSPSGEATKFVEGAIKNNVLIIPGCVFSERDTHFRISYAVGDEDIIKGTEILCSLV